MMPRPTCVKCGGHFFEIATHEPSGGNFKQNFVQCSKCGGLVGVLDYYNVGSLLKNQEDAISRLRAAVSDIDSRVRNIASRFR